MGELVPQDPLQLFYARLLALRNPQRLATFHYQGAQLIWHTNFVSRQYLDNTENNVRSLPCYSQTNIHANYTFRPGKRFAGLREVVVGCDFNNIFNRHYAASGWVYSTILDNDGHPNDNRYTQIGWIPLAGC